MRNGHTFQKTLLAFALLIVWLPLASGCAAKTLPPSEPTMVLLQGAYQNMRVLVDEGLMSPIEARDQYYKKLAEVEPPLPELHSLQEYRRQIKDELAAGELSPAQADSRLKERESELLAHWSETAAEYAAEQRRLERIQRDFERDYRQQRRIEEGSGIRNLPRP